MKLKNKHNKKGIIFALDGAIAATIVLIMLINTTYYFTTTSKESLSQTQIIKRGYDAVAMFDEAGKLSDALYEVTSTTTFIPDDDNIPGSLNVSNYLPIGYDMIVELDDAKKNNCEFNCVVTSENSLTLNTEFLNEGGDLYVQVNAKLNPPVTEVPKIYVKFGGISYKTTNICLNNACTYTTLEPILFPSSLNQIEIESDESNRYDVNWIKVLDDSAYTLTTERIIPDDRFVGAGERWYAAFDDNGHFEGFHKVRFKIWLT
tara:strand:+ start:301 stop:1083 length:783 start_codon:yes stop_codon:yes gene_type:complete